MTFLDAIYNECVIMHFVSFCVWLISVGIMSSTFIHLVANGRISFFFKDE